MRAFPLVLLMAACSDVADPPQTGTFRDRSTIIASKADFDPEAFLGDWHVIASFPDGSRCQADRLSVEAQPEELRIVRHCRGGQTLRASARPSGPGRLSVAGSEDLWVLWADGAYRTAVLARPDGSTGEILNREIDLPVDRLRAALEVLDFNGFETDALIFAKSR